METYIALLRGINISGKNKVSMPLLKIAFEDIGFSEVTTYINSGNVLFSTDINSKNQLIKMSKNMIAERFLFDIPVTVISVSELKEAVDNAPKWWDEPCDEEVIHQAIFLIPPITVAEVYTAVGELRADYEKVDFYKDIIFWSAPRATVSKTRWYKIASTSVNYDVTIRNANTTKKLLALTNR